MIVEKTIGKIVPSPYQEAIYKAVTTTNSNIVVKATAGSGKTTVIIQAAKLISPSLKTLFTSFNKDIVNELSLKLPSYVNCSTMHSLGYKALIKHFGTTFSVNSSKTFIFAKQKFNTKKLNKEQQKSKEKLEIPYCYAISSIIDLMRMNMLQPDPDQLSELCLKHDIQTGMDEIIDSIEIFHSLRAYNKHLNKKSMVDFTDMIYLPVSLNLEIPKHDIVFLDEAQDANTLQQTLLNKAMNPGARLIAVGDERQCLYSFMGSNPDIFRSLEKKQNTITLPLSVSYRCPKEVVKLARTIYPEIEPAPNAIDGIVRREGDIDEARPGDMIICRNTRPLVAIYFELISQHIAATIVGSEIEQGLKKMIVVDVNSKNELMHHLNMQLAELSVKLSNQGIFKPKNHVSYINMNEKVRAIEIIGNSLFTVKEIENKITEMFKEKENSIKLYTGHKSKGLEADRVFFVEKFEGKKLIPSPYATQDWEKEQERNLLFVIYTRAKKEFVFVKNYEDAIV